MSAETTSTNSTPTLEEAIARAAIGLTDRYLGPKEKKEQSPITRPWYKQPFMLMMIIGILLGMGLLFTFAVRTTK